MRGLPLTRRGTFAVLLALLALASPGPRPTHGSGAAAAADKAAYRKRAADQYVRYTRAVREQMLTPDSCPFSPEAVVLNLGGDPQALAAFVRDRIGYEPSAGAVRGAEGTLAAGAGGDWDRAVLLQALLAEAGYPARLKVVPRTPVEVERVVGDYLKRQPTVQTWFAGAGSERAVSADPPALLGQFGIPPENRRRHAARDAARLRGLLGECLDAAAHETPHLFAALKAAEPGRPFAQWRASLDAAAAERVYVEITGAGGPVALSVAPDPAPVDAARLNAAKTFDAPPADKIATVSVRLEMTAGEAGKPPGEAVRLIDRVLPMDTLFRRPIRLEIVPSDDAAAAKPTATWTKKDWHTFVGGFKTFQAILRVGDEWEGSKAFDLSGRLLEVAADGRVENASKIGGAVGSTFGGLLGGGGDEQDAAATGPETRIDSLVLVFEMSLPGEAPRTQRRLVYGKERPGATPVFTADALVTAGPAGPHTTSWLLLDAVTRNAPLAARLATSSDPRRFEQTDDAVRSPTMLYDWQTVRLMLAARLLAREPGLSYAGGPSLVLRGTHVTTDAAEKSVSTRHWIDVAFDDGLLLPRTAADAGRAARANAALGVASTVLESALLRTIDPAIGVKGPYAVFDEARAAGAAAVAVPPGADAAGAVVDPPALVAWSLARNESGRALVFARPDGATAWWSVDPATGRTIGRGDGGEGQSAMEYLQITKKNVDNLKCMVGLSNQLLGGAKSEDAAQEWLLCMTGTDNSGNGHGIPAGVEGAIDPDVKMFKIGIGPIADALGGAKDLQDALDKPGPILYTGR